MAARLLAGGEVLQATDRNWGAGAFGIPAGDGSIFFVFQSRAGGYARVLRLHPGGRQELIPLPSSPNVRPVAQVVNGKLYVSTGFDGDAGHVPLVFVIEEYVPVASSGASVPPAPAPSVMPAFPNLWRAPLADDQHIRDGANAEVYENQRISQLRALIGVVEWQHAEIARMRQLMQQHGWTA